MSKPFFPIPFTLLLILTGAPGLAASESVDVEQYRAVAVERWEAEIEKLEARDKAENHPDDSILFIGSSSIRRWEDIATDMAPYHPIQRGFGGSRWSDVAGLPSASSPHISSEGLSSSLATISPGVRETRLPRKWPDSSLTFSEKSASIIRPHRYFISP